MKGYIGLEMPSHGCPENFKGATFRPIGDQEVIWNKLMTGDIDGLEIEDK